MATVAGLQNGSLPPNHLINLTKKHKNSNLSTIPLIHSLVTDEDLGFSPEATFDPVKLQNAVDLLTCEHAKLLKKRHMNILYKIIAIYDLGFPLESLVNVLTILNACADFVWDDFDYEPIMVSIINLLQHPFIMYQSSDEISFSGIVTDTFAQLGYLLRVDSVEIRSAVIETLLVLYTRKQISEPTKETRRVSFDFLIRAIEESGVTDTVTKALALIDSEQKDLRNFFFNFLQAASFSEVNCNFMLNSNAGYILCLTLEGNLADYKLVQQTTEIIWNLIENGNQEVVLEQISNLQCLQVLHKLLTSELSMNHSAYHRTVRNDIVAIITLIARANPESPLIESGIVKTCLQILTLEETKTRNILLKHIKFHNNSEDFEFKKHLIALVLCFAKNRSTLHLFTEVKLFHALFHYVRPIRKIESPFDMSRLEEIQLQCLSTISSLTDYCPELTSVPDYVRATLAFLEWCIDEVNDPYLSQGNSFYSSGGRHSKKSQLRYTLRYLRQIIRASQEEPMYILLQNELVLKLTLLINDLVREIENPKIDKNPVTDKADEKEALCLDVTCESLYLLSMFCEQLADHKELLSKDGISLLVYILNIDPSKICRGLGYNKLLTATLEAIWSCVIGSSTNEKYFLESSGMFALLDLLEPSAKYLQSIILGCVLDLMENSMSIPHILTWENRDQTKAPKLMINLWKETERDLNINRGDLGIVQNMRDPLETLSSDADSDQKEPSLSSTKTKAIVEVSENLRAKIYSFFLKIPQEDLEDMQPSDYVWLSLIDKYLDFKSAEVWTGE